jgi:hypothetical protein
MPSAFQIAVRKALKADADPKVQEGFQRYFKNVVKLIGVRSAGVREVFDRSLKPEPRARR